MKKKTILISSLLDSQSEIQALSGRYELVRIGIYVLAINLALLSIWKYFIVDTEIGVGMMGLASAGIFIVVMEWSKISPAQAFSIGVIISLGMFILYVFKFGIKNLLIIDSLLFILIDALLQVGSRIKSKEADLRKEITVPLVPKVPKSLFDRKWRR